jgi:hypothetical protein
MMQSAEKRWADNRSAAQRNDVMGQLEAFRFRAGRM